MIAGTTVNKLSMFIYLAESTSDSDFTLQRDDRVRVIPVMN